MPTKRQARGPRKVLNERELEKKQLEVGTSTPGWCKNQQPVHPITEVRNKAKAKADAKQQSLQARTDRAANRADKENANKRKAPSDSDDDSEPEQSPAIKRIYMPRPEPSAPRREEQATGSGRSSQHADPTPACMTDEELQRWVAAQPGQTVPAEQHMRLLNEYRKLRHKHDELSAAKLDEMMQLLDNSLFDTVQRDARALANHWKLECDLQAGLAREAGTADLQQERDAATEKHQQLANELAEAVNARAAAMMRAAAAERELAAYRARVMATTGVQTDPVEVVDHSAQAPAGQRMRVQLMPEGLEGTLHSSMPAKGVLVPVTSSPGGTVQGAAGTPIHAPPRSSVRMPTPASAPQRLGQGSPGAGSPLGSHPAFPPSRHRTSRLRRTTLAVVQQGEASELRQPRFDSRESSELPAMSLATSAQGSGGTVAPVKTPGKNTPFGMMTGLERIKEDGDCVRAKHPRTGFVYELKKVDKDMFAYRSVEAGTLAGLVDQLPCWLFQEICFGADQRETFLASLFEALKQGS